MSLFPMLLSILLLLLIKNTMILDSDIGKLKSSLLPAISTPSKLTFISIELEQLLPTKSLRFITDIDSMRQQIISRLLMVISQLDKDYPLCLRHSTGIVKLFLLYMIPMSVGTSIKPTMNKKSLLRDIMKEQIFQFLFSLVATHSEKEEFPLIGTLLL